MAAAQALEKIREDGVCPALLETLEQDPNEYVRALAAMSLVQHDDARGMEFILEALDRHPRSPDRRIRQVLPSIGHKLVVLLTQAIYSPNERLAVLSTQALGNIWFGNYGTVNSLVRAVDHPNDRVRAAVMTALGKVGSRDTLPTLRSCLNDSPRTVRDTAQQALLRLEDLRAE
jgi:HEAT repeat protein